MVSAPENRANGEEIDARSRFEETLQLRPGADEEDGNQSLDRLVSAVAAVSETAAIAEHLTGWAAQTCGVPDLSDASYSALPPKARREHIAARLRLGLPVMPMAASQEVAYALEALAAGEVADLVARPAKVRRSGGAPLIRTRHALRRFGLGRRTLTAADQSPLRTAAERTFRL